MATRLLGRARRGGEHRHAGRSAPHREDAQGRRDPDERVAVGRPCPSRRVQAKHDRAAPQVQNLARPAAPHGGGAREAHGRPERQRDGVPRRAGQVRQVMRDEVGQRRPARAQRDEGDVDVAPRGRLQVKLAVPGERVGPQPAGPAGRVGQAIAGYARGRLAGAARAAVRESWPARRGKRRRARDAARRAGRGHIPPGAWEHAPRHGRARTRARIAGIRRAEQGQREATHGQGTNDKEHVYTIPFNSRPSAFRIRITTRTQDQDAASGDKASTRARELSGQACPCVPVRPHAP